MEIWYRNLVSVIATAKTQTGRVTAYNMITGTTVDRRNDHREGILAKTIEEQTAKLPSDTFLWAAGGSIAASLTLKLIGRDKDALFVGQWAPTFLILGLYNKLVKQLGSDRTENQL